jgi:hypothetical protein
MNSPYWFEVAVVCGLTAIGTILLGHFEAGTPKWRRVLKVILASALGVGISAAFGRGAFWASLGVVLVAVTIIHAWWLPRQGVHGWTGEPRDRYYRLRGWKFPDGTSS